MFSLEADQMATEQIRSLEHLIAEEKLELPDAADCIICEAVQGSE
jgi:hypothetical protein